MVFDYKAADGFVVVQVLMSLRRGEEQGEEFEKLR